MNGGLSAGYGASSGTIGPELQFGHAMGDSHGENVLIIKTAWGGKSLRTDFRPPSSGWSKDAPITAGDEGYYYQEMLDAVVDAMANISTNFPAASNLADGYEIAGFAWHQGWNDRVSPTFAAEYEANMVNFITDVRSSLGVPDLPFVIATTGMDGNPDYSEVELAQLQMENFTAYPQFDGNVAVTDTQGFYFDVASSPADQGYHWNRNAKSYYQIGASMAAEMQTLIEGGGGGNDFSDWINGYSLTDTSFNGDSDGDNLGNGIEAFFGTAPDIANAGLAQVSQSGAMTSFTHPVAEPPLGNVTGSYEWSIDLVNWHPSGTVSNTSVTIAAGAPVNGTTTVTADSTGSTVTPAQLFIRVIATEN